MPKINVARWLLGGVVAGAIVWVIEGAGSVLYMDRMLAIMQAHNLAMEMSSAMMAMSILVSLLAGLTLMFFYVAARPRFGPGPRTAITVAVALWLGGYVTSLIGYHMVGLYPPSMLVLWATIGLVELCVAALVGGMIYQER